MTKLKPSSLTSFETALDRVAILVNVDIDGRITHANKNFFELTSFSTEEIIGSEFRLLSVDLEKVILNNDVWQGEICLRCRAGAPLVWLEVRVLPTTDEAPRVHRFVAICFDITERKLREGRQEKTTLELEHFAYAAAHDLHEPLRKISAFTGRLVARYTQQLESDGQDYLPRIQGAVTRMQRLIDDLLAYSRVAHRTERFKEQFKTVDLNQTLHNVLGDLEIPIEQLQQTNPVKAGPLPTIEGAPSELHRLVQNLVSNALKFRATDRPVEVTITATVADETCTLSVRDNGIGLGSENLERIFNAFNRLHSQNQFPGSGLGLAICRRITDHHQGSISVKSTPGAGSEFLVTLPLKQKPERTP
jgi:PAS domain S-box-containing protein